MKLLSLILLINFVQITYAAALVDPRLLELAAKSPDERVKVLLVLSELPDLSTSLPAAEKIQKLQALSRKEQEPVIEMLSGMRAGSIDSLWIANTIAVEIQASQIALAATMDGVLRIEENTEILQDDPLESHADTAESGDVTYGLEQIKVPRVWEEYSLRGEGIVVGIIDSGVDSNHPELNGKVIRNRDFIEGYPDNKPNDATGHGTHCAGTIAGSNLGETAIGVAPKARVISGKIFNKSGRSDSETVLKAMQWIVDPDGNPNTDDFPRLVSNSWGGQMGSTFHRAVKVWENLGILPVFAAGNSGPRKETMAAPAGYKESFAVGATKEDGSIANFSSRGPVFYENEKYIKPDIAAPGYDVYSAQRGGGYRKASGTSMACPHVAGSAALVFQANPMLEAKMVRRILEVTALDTLATGKDNLSGWGIMNLYEAVKLSKEGGIVQLKIGTEIQNAVAVISQTGQVFDFDLRGVSDIPLKKGRHELVIKAYGYQTETRQVEISEQGIERINLKMKQSPATSLQFRVFGESGTLIPARIRIHDTPLDVLVSSTGEFKFDLPRGSYQIDVLAKGFRKQTQLINTANQGSYTFQLVRLPSVLLADLSSSNHYKDYYTRALNRLNLSYEIASDQLDADLFEGYALIIWFTGNAYQSTITQNQQEMLTQVIKNGGRFILTGQDASFALKREPFYQDVLGSVMVIDETKERQITGLGLELRINGQQSASNQTYPDELNTHFKAKNARIILNWANGKGAGILNSYGTGKTVNLGFGMEGLSGNEEVFSLLKALIEEIEPPLESRIQSLINAYLKNKEEYNKLIKQFILPSFERERAEAILKNYLDKGIEIPRDLIVLIRTENVQ